MGAGPSRRMKEWKEARAARALTAEGRPSDNEAPPADPDQASAAEEDVDAGDGRAEEMYLVGS
jgi:hypothetical protein